MSRSRSRCPLLSGSRSRCVSLSLSLTRSRSRPLSLQAPRVGAQIKVLSLTERERERERARETERERQIKRDRDRVGRHSDQGALPDTIGIEPSDISPSPYLLNFMPITQSCCRCRRCRRKMSFPVALICITSRRIAASACTNQRPEKDDLIVPLGALLTEPKVEPL